MAIYAALLNEPNRQVWNALEESYPGRYYIMTENIAFVSPDGISTSAHVATALGLDGELDAYGVVVAVSAYNGFNSLDLWEWLNGAMK